MQILMFQSIIFTEIHNIIYALKPSLEFRMGGTSLTYVCWYWYVSAFFHPHDKYNSDILWKYPFFETKLKDIFNFIIIKATDLVLHAEFISIILSMVIFHYFNLKTRKRKIDKRN